MGTIAQEISRIQTAKSNLATSITNKGVTVPSSTKIDGYAALVDQIQQGSAENAFMKLTDLTGIFAYKLLEKQAYKDGLERYAENTITNISYTFFDSEDEATNNSEILNLIGQIVNRSTIVDCERCFQSFSNFQSNNYNKTLDLSNLRVSGKAGYFLNTLGNSYGTLLVKLNSEAFKEATRCEYIFGSMLPSAKIKLNESKLYFNKNTNFTYMFFGLTRSDAFIDNSDNQIKDIDIYMNEDAASNYSANSMFTNCHTFERINFKNGMKVNSINNMLQGCNYLKSITGLDASRITGTNYLFGSQNLYLTNFGELGMSSGLAIGGANNTVLNIAKIWNVTADTVIDGQTAGYWYEKFANAIGNKTASGTVTITINTTLFNSLTATQKQLITDKGYTLAYSS